MRDFKPFMKKPKFEVNLFNHMSVFKVQRPEYVPSVITDWGGPNWPDFCLVIINERD